MANTYRNVYLRDGYQSARKASACLKHLNKKRARRQHAKIVRADLAETLEGIKLDQQEMAELDAQAVGYDYMYDPDYDYMYEEDMLRREEEAMMREEAFWNNYDPFEFDYGYDDYCMY